ncbi:MAG: restriction endonuclease subunit S [Porphyromonas sp.]|nr:restriction endonuclease subunit S [Porphyromonas sp.]
MATNKTQWVRLGDYIEQCDDRNTGRKYFVEDVRGISIEKKFIYTKANLDGVALAPYKLVNPLEFGYVSVTSRNGGKISLAINNSKQTYIVSSSYEVFKCKSELLPEYLYMLLSRSEFDRYARFNSWGSARETFSWEELCRVSIPLPSMEVQRDLVATYEGLQRLAEDNEALIAPLTEACQAFIIDCKRKYPSVPLGDYIEEVDERNTAGKRYPFCGVNKDKTFMPTMANITNLDNRKYKLVEQGLFVFSGMQTGRDECIRIAYQNEPDVLIISPAYTTFRVKETSELLPQFLYMQFIRQEMDRLGWFLSDGSIRSNLDWDRFCDIRIPLPPIEVQESIVRLYHCIEEAKSIAQEAREQLRALTPALVQYAIHS